MTTTAEQIAALTATAIQYTAQEGTDAILMLIAFAANKLEINNALRTDYAAGVAYEPVENGYRRVTVAPREGAPNYENFIVRSSLIDHLESYKRNEGMSPELRNFFESGGVFVKCFEQRSKTPVHVALFAPAVARLSTITMQQGDTRADLVRRIRAGESLAVQTVLDDLIMNKTTDVELALKACIYEHSLRQLADWCALEVAHPMPKIADFWQYHAGSDKMVPIVGDDGKPIKDEADKEVLVNIHPIAHIVWLNMFELLGSFKNTKPHFDGREAAYHAAVCMIKMQQLVASGATPSAIKRLEADCDQNCKKPDFANMPEGKRGKQMVQAHIVADHFGCESMRREVTNRIGFLHAQNTVGAYVKMRFNVAQILEEEILRKIEDHLALWNEEARLIGKAGNLREGEKWPEREVLVKFCESIGMTVDELINLNADTKILGEVRTIYNSCTEADRAEMAAEEAKETEARIAAAATEE